MELLAKHFELALETPDGIKKLRELILSLAMQGKLVPQDPKDQPASELLQSVEAEKKRLVKIGKLKNHLPLLQVKNEEMPYNIPSTWEWVRIGTIAQHNSGKTLDHGRNKGMLREYITTSNLYWGKFVLNELRKMPIMDSELEKCSAKKGDLLICEGGEAGRAAVWESTNEICFQNHIHRVRFYSNINPYYAYRFFEKIHYTGEINNYRKGVAISNMSAKALASIIFPLPPFLEQKRIVSKISQLMALCDKLEAEHNERNSKRLIIHTAAINKLLTASDKSEFNKAWNFITKNFNELYSVPENIEELKKAILQLAVTGKLVPRDPKDQPVSELLKEIELEKKQFLKDGKIKSQEDLPPIKNEKMPCELPIGWGWIRLREIIIDSMTGLDQGKSLQSESFQFPYFKMNNITNSGMCDFTNIVRINYDKGDFEKYLLHDNDFLFNTRNSLELVGKTCVFYRPNKERWFFNNNILRIRFLRAFDPHFINLWFLSPAGRKELEKIKSSTTNVAAIYQGKLESFPVPILSLNWQRRIVAKTNQLMGLCNTLQQQLNDSTKKKTAILNGVVQNF